MVVPPTVNLNTPYAAAPRLAGWLRQLGHTVVPGRHQPSCSRACSVATAWSECSLIVDPSQVTIDELSIYRNRDQYLRIIEDAVAVVQLRDLTATTQIVYSDSSLPRCAWPGRRPHPDGSTDFKRYRGPRHAVELMDLFKSTPAPPGSPRRTHARAASSLELRSHRGRAWMSTELANIPPRSPRSCCPPTSIWFASPARSPATSSVRRSSRGWRLIALARRRALGGGRRLQPRARSCDGWIRRLRRALVDGELPLQQIQCGLKDATTTANTFTREDDTFSGAFQRAIPLAISPRAYAGFAEPLR